MVQWFLYHHKHWLVGLWYLWHHGMIFFLWGFRVQSNNHFIFHQFTFKCMHQFTSKEHTKLVTGHETINAGKFEKLLTLLCVFVTFSNKKSQICLFIKLFSFLSSGYLKVMWKDRSSCLCPVSYLPWTCLQGVTKLFKLSHGVCCWRWLPAECNISHLWYWGWTPGTV